MNLHDYDLVIINTSAGKDSQAMMDVVVSLAGYQTFPRSRIVAVHCALKANAQHEAEWDGTEALAREHAQHYGLRFEVVANAKGILDRVLERFERRPDAPSWPDAANRFCTSEQKTAQVQKVMTRLVAEHREAHGPRVVKILNCLGIRAEESPARAKKPEFEVDKATNGKRLVHRWLPIHAWTEAEVWKRIERAGTRPHPAYAKGMPRLSCAFCVLASKGALVRAAQLNPTLAQEYVRVERLTGWAFRKGQKLEDIVAEAERTAAPVKVEGWVA